MTSWHNGPGLGFLDTRYLLPVVDTQTIVKGSADPTKLLRFEVDGFTAGVTRVMTPPDQDATLAGLNVVQTFTQIQTVAPATIIDPPAAIGVLDVTASYDGTVNNGNTIQTSNFRVETPTTSTINFTNAVGVAALNGTAVHQGSGTVTNLVAGFYVARNLGVGIITNAKALYARSAVNSGGGVITNAFGLDVQSQTAGVTNYAIRTNDGLVVFNEGGSSTSNLRVEGDTDQNLICTDPVNDRLGIGTASPDFKLSVHQTNTVNSAITNILQLTHERTGATAGAAGMGSGILLRSESSVNDTFREQVRLTSEWGVATDASRSAIGKLSAFLIATEVECIRWDATGLVTMPMLRLTSATAASVSSTLHAFQVGLDAGLNIIMDNDDIMARSAGAATTLFLNRSAGRVQCNIVWGSATTATTLAGTNQALQTGLNTGANLAFDTTTIQARNNGAASELTLNPLGGNILVGIAGASLGFYGSARVAQQTVTGSRGGNAALADLLTKLATLGLIIDGSS